MRYADGSVDVALPGLARVRATGSGREKARPAPTAGWALCPRCTARTALKAAGAHLQWAVHSRTSALGHRSQCTGSGMLLCGMPPRDGLSELRVTGRQREQGLGLPGPWRCRCGARARP